MTDKIRPITNTGATTGRRQARMDPDGPSFKDFMNGGKRTREEAPDWLPDSLYEGMLTHDDRHQRHILIGDKGLDLLHDIACADGRVVLRVDHIQHGILESSLLVIEGKPLDPPLRILLQPRKGPWKLTDSLTPGQDIITKFSDPAMAHIRGDSLGARFVAKLLAVSRPGEPLDAVPAPPGWQAVIGRIDGREKGKLSVESPIGQLLMETGARPASDSPILFAIPDTARLTQDAPVLALSARDSLKENMAALKRQQALQQAGHAVSDQLSSLVLPEQANAQWGIQQAASIPVFGETGYDDPNRTAAEVKSEEVSTDRLHHLEDSANLAGLTITDQLMAQAIDDIQSDKPPDTAPTLRHKTLAEESHEHATTTDTNTEDKGTAESGETMVNTVSQPSQPTPSGGTPSPTSGPAPGVQTPPQTATQHSANAAAMLNNSQASPVSVSSGAAGLVKGEVITAMVTGTDSQGRTTLQSGGVTLTTATPLPKDLAQKNEFQLRIISTDGNRIEAEVIIDDDRVALDRLRSAANAARQSNPSQQGQPPQEQARYAPGSAPSLANAVAGQDPKLAPPQKTLSLVFTKFSGPPATDAANPALTATNPAAGGLRPGMILSGILANALPGSALPSGTLLQFNILSVQLPGPTVPGTAHPGNGASQLSGTPGAVTTSGPGTGPASQVAGQTPTPASATTGNAASTTTWQVPNANTMAAGLNPGGPGATPGVATGTLQNIIPGAPQASLAGIGPGDNLPARVVAHSNGNMILETSMGTVSVPSDKPLPIGTSLMLGMQKAQKPYAMDAMKMAMMGEESRLSALDTLSREWPALKEALSVLQAASPDAAHSLMSRMPAMNARLTANILFFMNALGSNNVARFTGNAAMEMLQSMGRADIADQLSSDFSQLGRLSSETSNSDWRAFMLPFFNGQNLHQLPLYLDQRHQNGMGRGKGGGNTHFVIELDFTELGPMQLDGLVEPVKDNPLVRYDFNLTLHTHQKLDEAMMEHIGSVFYAGLDVGGLTGKLSFSVSPTFPEYPMEDLTSSNDGDIIV